MNRRAFLQKLAIAAFAVYAQISPKTVAPERVIVNSSGALTLEMFNTYLERIFRTHKQTEEPPTFYFSNSKDADEYSRKTAGVWGEWNAVVLEGTYQGTAKSFREVR